VFKAVVLEILVEMALVAIENEQSVCSCLSRLCMRIKMLQPLKTKRSLANRFGVPNTRS
jgi:hypothetical protein